MWIAPRTRQKAPVVKYLARRRSCAEISASLQACVRGIGLPGISHRAMPESVARATSTATASIVLKFLIHMSADAGLQEVDGQAPDEVRDRHGGEDRPADDGLAVPGRLRHVAIADERRPVDVG